LSDILGYIAVLVVALVGTIGMWLLFALIFRYSFNERHLVVNLVGVLCVRSIPYSQIVDVQVVPWWKEFSSQFCPAERWPSHMFSREVVMIVTNSMCPYIFLSPSAPIIFAQTLAYCVAKAKEPSGASPGQEVTSS